jgi:hypothetical protein
MCFVPNIVSATQIQWQISNIACLRHEAKDSDHFCEQKEVEKNNYIDYFVQARQ